MRKFNYYFPVLLFIALTSIITSCDKEDDPIITANSSARINIEVSNEVDGSSIALGSCSYVNHSNETYSINLLKYYLSHASLVDSNGNEVELVDHALIDPSNPASLEIGKDAIPNGNYQFLKFNVGIEEAHNHTGDQEGVLDPIHGMIWTWDTGYIFFKHEGQFIDANGDTSPIVYHYGTDEAFVSVQVPISFELKGEDINIKLTFNLNTLYGSPNMVAFENNFAHQSTGVEDIPWINDLKENFTESFSASLQD